MRLWIGVGILAILIVAGISVMTSSQQKQAESQYQAALTTYRSALKTGSTRTQVEDYLRQQGVSFTRACCDPKIVSDRASLGDEPRNLFCQPWNVYLDFEFSGSSGSASVARGSDLLTSIDLHKEGVCF